MQAEIISIGTELTSGEKLDTNSQWLSLELSQLGIPVRFHTTMADDKAAMLEVCRTAVQRSDFVLVTGGLGPTLDDLTRELIAEVVGVELVLDEPSLAYIRDLFAKRSREFPERNRIQAMFPAGSEPLFNPIGTAPGIWMEIARTGRSPCRLAAMPGVPSEMKRMYREQVQPRLPSGEQVIRRLCLHCYGMGESAIEEKLGDLTVRNRNPEVGITASAATITLRIAASGATIAECEGLIERDRQFIHETLGDLVYGDDDETLEDVVMQLLNEQDKSVGSIEAGTAGMLAQALASAAQRTAAEFLGSLVMGWEEVVLSEGTEAKPDGIKSALSAMAQEMAKGARAQFHSSFALAITPLGRPTQAGAPPFCFIALAEESKIEVQEHLILSDLSIAAPRATKTALNMLRLRLLETRRASH